MSLTRNRSTTTSRTDFMADERAYLVAWGDENGLEVFIKPAGADQAEEMAFVGRWCTRQIQGEMALHPKLLRDDRLATDGVRPPGRQHPVQHRHADGSLSLLGREAAGSQTRSDQRLVATHCRFY